MDYTAPILATVWSVATRGTAAPGKSACIVPIHVRISWQLSLLKGCSNAGKRALSETSWLWFMVSRRRGRTAIPGWCGPDLQTCPKKEVGLEVYRPSWPWAMHSLCMMHWLQLSSLGCCSCAPILMHCVRHACVPTYLT